MNLSASPNRTPACAPVTLASDRVADSDSQKPNALPKKGPGCSFALPPSQVRSPSQMYDPTRWNGCGILPSCAVNRSFGAHSPQARSRPSPLRVKLSPSVWFVDRDARAYAMARLVVRGLLGVDPRVPVAEVAPNANPGGPVDRLGGPLDVWHLGELQVGLGHVPSGRPGLLLQIFLRRLEPGATGLEMIESSREGRDLGTDPVQIRGQPLLRGCRQHDQQSDDGEGDERKLHDTISHV